MPIYLRHLNFTIYMDFSYNRRLSTTLAESNFNLQDVIKILNTLPSGRSQVAIRTLQNYTESIPLFKQIVEENDQQVFKECCQCLKYQFHHAGSYVFKTGEKGDYFYIIFDGEVSITAKNDKDEILEEICRLGSGGSFGELAIIKDQPRSATIQCSKPTHFATLYKNDYLRILGQMSSRRLEELINFFYSLPTFDGWSKRNLIKLSYYFRAAKYKRNQIIFNEGEPANSVFIVKSGEVELSKTIRVQKPTIRRIGNEGRPMPALKTGNYTMQAKLSLANVGEIIGDDDITHDLPRSITCKCYSSSAELLEISKIEFKKRIRSEESLNQLTERQKSKDSHISSAISLLKIIKEPSLPNSRQNQGRCKEYLDCVRSLNPWNSAQSLFGKINIPQTTAHSLPHNSQLLKKAIKSVAVYRSLQISPNLSQKSLKIKSLPNSPKGILNFSSPYV